MIVETIFSRKLFEVGVDFSYDVYFSTNKNSLYRNAEEVIFILNYQDEKIFII